MARCPFARQVPATSAGSSHRAGPWKVVHHKTISFSENANALYGRTGSWPHFTVGPSGVQQHYDTEIAARALRNRIGGVETNRHRAIQIEVVGNVGVTAPKSTLEHLKQLLGWIKETHGVPDDWPAGRPKQAVNGRDPGGHNRSVDLWISRSGHFGHSQVPENTHWDPAYTNEEWDFLTLSQPPLKKETRKEVSGVKLVTLDAEIGLDSNGNGWGVFNAPYDQVTSFFAMGPNPEREGYWVTPNLAAQAHNGKTLVTATKGASKGVVRVVVKVLKA